MRGDEREQAQDVGRIRPLAEGERLVELREEQLVAHKDLREVGEIRVRTQVEEVPGRLEVEAFREEAEVEHVPIGQVVTERESPWEEEGVLVVPVYEEQVVTVKRLLLREYLRIRRVATTETRLFEDTLRRERLVVEDPQNTGRVHEQAPAREQPTTATDEDTQRQEGGLLSKVVRKVLD